MTVLSFNEAAELLRRKREGPIVEVGNARFASMRPPNCFGGNTATGGRRGQWGITLQ